jgi:hypothetical protein
MVLRDLERSPRASEEDFAKIIDAFPLGIEGRYTSFTPKISAGHRKDAGELLRLLIGVSEPLNVEVMNIVRGSRARPSGIHCKQPR